MQKILIGSYACADEAGIFSGTLDETGTFRKSTGLSGVECPSYLALGRNGTVLYAVSEHEDAGELYTFTAGETGFQPAGCLPTAGSAACHIEIDPDGEFLIVCNYLMAAVNVYRLDANGIPAERTCFVKLTGSGPNPVRQPEAHAHFSMFLPGDHNRIAVCDLGTDAVRIFTLNRADGTIVQTGSISMPAGCGPRHLAACPVRSDLLYCISEMGCQVHTLRLEGSGGEVLQSFASIPAGFAGEADGAAIRAANGCVYASTRLFYTEEGGDCVVCLRMKPDGMLEEPQYLRLRGSLPRDICIAGKYLLAACQNSRTLEAVALDETGRMVETAAVYPVPHAICALIPCSTSVT